MLVVTGCPTLMVAVKTGLYPNDAMLRQISEGVRIEKVPGDSLINSKNEWNFFQIPRAVIPHGRALPSAWHTVHATEIEIDQSELSTRGKLSFPTS